MAGKTGRSDVALDVGRLQEEHKKVVKGCEGQIEHWQKIEKDYDCLQERLKTLPDQLSYDIMVPFGPLAFMPGKLVHTNEVTVLLGDNWFAKCSAKQAEKIVEHRKTHVKKTLDDLHKVVKNFEGRASFTEDLDRVSGSKGDYVDIREKVLNEEATTKGKRRMAHKPHSKPKIDFAVDLIEEVDIEEEDQGVKVKVTETEGSDGGDHEGVLTEEDLWAQLDALEAQEEQLDERDRMCDSTDTNGEDTSSSSSEEEKERDGTGQTNGNPEEDHGTSDTHNRQLNGVLHTHPEEEEDEEEDDDEEEDPNALPTIYFSHTVEPKKVRINTGKNTMLKFSERKEQMEQAKKKKKKIGKANGHSRHDQHHKITSPADIYRLFVDKVNGELIPRKSILKSRSRENSVCSDTSESSAADFEERRSMLSRAFSHDDNTHSDTSDYVTEEDSPPGVPTHTGSRFEAFSGTVVEKDPLPSSIPHLTIAPPALPTILERKSEELCTETPQEPPKRVSKFKAARLQQK
ncbi:unconventional prefoldin RPB5 interactor 1 [Engraulis encrasicolus]|uniref:unconventional prefoldin RPB5 interactor 1 n=1 Tax=Engraulis encrasicolus TaxID=184585 RepID=UPI002FD5B36B